MKDRKDKAEAEGDIKVVHVLLLLLRLTYR